MAAVNVWLLEPAEDFAINSEDAWTALTGYMRMYSDLNQAIPDDNLKELRQRIEEKTLTVFNAAISQCKADTVVLPQHFFMVNREFSVCFPQSHNCHAMITATNEIRTRSEKKRLGDQLNTTIADLIKAVEANGLDTLDMTKLLAMVPGNSGLENSNPVAQSIDKMFEMIVGKFDVKSDKETQLAEHLKEATSLLSESRRRLWSAVFDCLACSSKCHVSQEGVSDQECSFLKVSKFRSELAVASKSTEDLGKILGDMEDSDMKSLMVVVHAAGKEITEEAQAIDRSKHEAAVRYTTGLLKDAIDALQPIAGGAQDGNVWHKEIDQKNGWQEFLKGATAFLEKDHTDLNTKAQLVFEHIGSDKEKRSLAGENIDLETYDEARKVALRAMCTVSEHGIVKALQEKTKTAKRNGIQPIIRNLRSAGVDKDWPKKHKAKYLLCPIIFSECMGILS